jgi:hypothetical protein
VIRANHMALRLFITGTVLAMGSVASADEPEGGAQPYRLFVEGRQLAAAGQYEEAIPRFVESEALDPAPGTMANLAFCYARLGHTASAWIAFKTTARLARENGKFAWATQAEMSAADLEKSATKLVIDVRNPDNTEDLQVWLDHIEIPKALWVEAVPTSPGQHELRATASGKREWSSSFEVDATSAPRIVVPPLEPLPAPSAGPSLPALPLSREASLPQNGQGGIRRTSAWVMGGAGLASLVAGSILTIASKSSYSSANPDCAKVCTPEGSSLRSTAISEANAASVLFALAAAAAAGGVVLWWSSGTPSRPGVQLTPSLAAKQMALSVSGQWQ